ncbi:MAG TPA: HU family DNA-binding protein [Armatimonadota bacterium]|nr:HU family DNA-binding protein [Armatimonadota bacterium]
MTDMTKPELVDQVAAKTGMKKKDAAVTVDAVLETIQDTLNRKEEVSLVGFGTFDVRARGERMGRNPRTGEQITIPASTVCIFRPGRKLREAVGG